MVRIARALRRVAGGTMVLLLALAPLVVALTHGPGAAHPAEAAVAHGHAHDAAGPAALAVPGIHEAADHDHQTQAVAPAAGPAPADPRRGGGAWRAGDDRRGDAGPRARERPPRGVAA